MLVDYSDSEPSEEETKPTNTKNTQNLTSTVSVPPEKVIIKAVIKDPLPAPQPPQPTSKKPNQDVPVHPALAKRKPEKPSPERQELQPPQAVSSLKGAKMVPTSVRTGKPTLPIDI